MCVCVREYLSLKELIGVSNSQIKGVFCTEVILVHHGLCKKTGSNQVLKLSVVLGQRKKNFLGLGCRDVCGCHGL